MSSTYRLTQRVEATVEQVFPFGVFVRLDDGTRAYIRRRELTLDPDVDPATVVAQGDQLSALVTGRPEADKCMELSCKAVMPDPWPDFVRRHPAGDVVKGTVTRLFPTGVFVRLTPGVSGFIPLAELAPWSVEKADELLWVGDEVEAVVTRLESKTKRIQLSIRARMRMREGAVAMAEQLTTGSEAPSPVTSRDAPEHEPARAITPEERKRIGHILVVDDHDEVRQPLARLLTQRGYQVAEANTLDEALQAAEHHGSNVLLVDLQLPDGDGLDLAHWALQHEKHLCMCVMSSPEWLAERASDVERAHVAQVFVKPLDVEEIDAFLLRLAHDDQHLPVWRSSQRKEAIAPIVSESFLLESSRLPNNQRLPHALEKLMVMMRAEKAVLFERDPDSRVVTIVGQAGELPLSEEALYELDDSPVKDVICEGEPVFANKISEPVASRFRKLLNLLSFGSCIGIPIEVFDEVRHTIFFFHRKQKAFPRHRFRDAQVGAVWLGALLEKQRFDERVLSLGSLVLSGELALGFSHEVYNRISGLELRVQNLLTNVNRSKEDRAELSSLNELIKGTKEMAEVFQKIARAKGEREEINVNDIVRRAESQIKPLARRAHVTMAFHLAPDLPSVSSNGTWLQQVILNIMLNAVQQIEIKRDKHRLLEIRTTYGSEDGERSIKLRFTDTGPGIHKQLWERIFTLGFTTRPEGTGLGLFVVRSLLEALGAAVRVEESYIPLGTTFLVELPCSRNGRRRNE